MKHPKVYHFADDTNIPQFNAFIIDLALKNESWPEKTFSMVENQQVFPQRW